MDWIMWVLAVGAWIGCGVLAKGGLFAFSQGEWPTIAQEHYKQDKQWSTWAIPAGPCALLAALITTQGFKHGWRWK